MPAVRFPKLGIATREGTVLEWLKAVGESVQAGDELVEVLAEKAISVVVAQSAGMLSAVYAPPGAIVAEGELLAWIGAAGTAAPPHRLRLRGWDETLSPAPADLTARLAEPERGGTAEALGGESDAAAPVSAQTKQKPGKQAREAAKQQLRQATGQRLAESWRAPKVDLFTDVDFTRVVAHRQASKAAGREPPSYNVYIAHAAARAFERFPELNAHWIDGRIVPVDGIHVGVAVALANSLVTVSMKGLAGVPLEEIQSRFKALIRKAASMSLSREDMYGSSLTITNLGEYEVTGFSAVLNPPELFILAIGMLQERVVPRDGEPAVVPYSTFCLSFDHRGVDGAPASRLLREIKHILEGYGEG